MVKFSFVSLLALASLSVFANSKGDRIIQEIDGLKPPQFDSAKRQDQAYVKSYSAQYQAYLGQKNDLILQLFHADPDNPKTVDLMEQRWMRFDAPTNPPSAYIDKVDADIDKVLSENPPTAIRDVGEFCKVMVFSMFGQDSKKAQAMSDDFVNSHPTSDLSAELLFSESFQAKGDDQTRIYHEIVDKFPHYKNLPMVKGALAQTEAIGKPFGLSFTDAVSGKAIDLSALKGKVVLVDFWATWCGPCVAEMPHVKEIYSQYHDKGLEIVGVSLDEPEAQGGLGKLKDFVAKHQIPWPMYYQGNGWDSKFSSSWGIMSIPTMFIVDKQGNFQGATDARAGDFMDKLSKFLGQ